MNTRISIILHDVQCAMCNNPLLHSGITVLVVRHCFLISRFVLARRRLLRHMSITPETFPLPFPHKRKHENTKW